MVDFQNILFPVALTDISPVVAPYVATTGEMSARATGKRMFWKSTIGDSFHLKRFTCSSF